MRKIALILVVLMAVSTMVFARGQAAGDDGQVRIALLMRNVDEQFLKDYADNVRKLAAEKNVALNVQDARSDQQQQLTQLQTLINQGYKYFVIVPCISDLSDQFNQMIQRVGGAAAYSNTQPTVSSLKVGQNFFFASSPEFVGGSYQGGLIADYFDKNPAKAPGKAVNMLLING